MVTEGKKAPAFTLNDDKGNKISLKDLKGSKVVLYFYPKDMTSGCTKEAVDFKENNDEFKKLNTKVIGVSKDSVKSHQKFIEKYELPFPLLSDEETLINQKYEVWKEKSMYGRKYMGTERSTFIIDEEGKIAKIYPKVKVTGHVEEVLKFIKEMK